MKTLAGKLGAILAAVHACAFLATLVHIRMSTDGQAPLEWGAFAIIDFPISLLYYLSGSSYSSWLHGLTSPLLAQVFYLPHLIHGPLGAAWWYTLPRLFMPKRLGGIW